MSEQLEWIRSYVEKLLREASDDEPMQEDVDGDFPLRWGTSSCWIRVFEADQPMVRV